MKAYVVIVECWGFFAPYSMSNLIGGLLLDAIIFGGSFITLVNWIIRHPVSRKI